MITGNIGEWSELYTLLKVLGDGTLVAGDENLDQLPNVIYPVLKVLRSETSGNVEYSVNKNIIFIKSNGEEILKLPAEEFSQKAQEILNEFEQKKGAFSIPSLELFMEKIHCKSLKASSTQKTDITIVIHDDKTNQQPTLGFSIKSQLGSPSTLLNAGKTTNFKYKVSNLNSDLLPEINAITGTSKIKRRVEKIKELGGIITFESLNNSVFSNNLILIDSYLPQIVAHIVLNYYDTPYSSIADLVAQLEKNNPLHFDNSNDHHFYTYKIKKMLTDIALGLTPAKVWNGLYDATGGYLVVKDNGDILCYHLYNKNDFENYLFFNTKLDTASETRHDFGKLYEEHEELYLNLNLQIRFKK